MGITTEIIGFIAATLTTVSFFPQAIKVIRTRETEAISLHMYILFTLGVVMWLAYGILLKSLPIILANCVTVCLAGTILYMKLKEK